MDKNSKEYTEMSHRKTASADSFVHSVQLQYYSNNSRQHSVETSKQQTKDKNRNLFLYDITNIRMFQHSPFLLVVTWNRTYIFVVFRYRVIFSPRLEFSPSCVVASSKKFQLAASQNYTLFAYNLIIHCLRYCDF